MAPDDPLRLLVLLTGILSTFAAIIWGRRWRRRAVDLEIRLRVCVAQEAARIEARAGKVAERMARAGRR